MCVGNVLIKEMQGLVNSGFTIGIYPISFRVNIESFMWQKSVQVIAFLPSNYPNTSLKQTFGGKVAEVALIVRPERITVLQLRVFSSIRTSLFDRTVRLETEEIQGTKGLGKAILCYAIQQVWNYFEKDLVPFSDLVVDLETGATNFYSSSEFRRLTNQYNHLTKSELISSIIAWYPNGIEWIEYLDQKSESELRKMYTEHIENRQLANYYHNTYGFRSVVDDYLTEPFEQVENTTIVMEAPISVILEHCNF